MENNYKIGDLVCRTNLYTQYFLLNKKISKNTLNISIGTITAVEDDMLSIKLLNEHTVYVTAKGAWMKLDNRLADGLEIDE